MTAKANHSTQLRSCPSPLVLFGIDSRGKPKGARFGREHASLAIKAATQLQLNVLASNDPNVAEIAGRLPVGRVHATGRTFVPFIRRDLYDRLVAATGNGNGASPVRLTHAGVAAASPPSGNPNLPRSWHEIALGDLVVGRLVRSDCNRSQRRHADVALARLPATTTYRTPPSSGRAPLPGTTRGCPSQQTNQASRSSKAKRSGPYTCIFAARRLAGHRCQQACAGER
jgi:hypothetical protein